MSDDVKGMTIYTATELDMAQLEAEDVRAMTQIHLRIHEAFHRFTRNELAKEGYLPSMLSTGVWVVSDDGTLLAGDPNRRINAEGMERT